MLVLHLVLGAARSHMPPSHAHLVVVARALRDTFSISASLITSKEFDATGIPPILACARFQVSGILGHGSEGFVYMARDQRQSQKHVAVKITFAASSSSRQATYIQQGHQAHSLCRSFFTSRIIYSRMLTTETDELLLVCVSDVCDLGDLRNSVKTFIAKQQCFVEAHIACQLAQLGVALHHLHRQNIIHHDIKTANILACRNGLVQIADYGYARVYPSCVHSNVAHSMCGSPNYMAPEVWLRQPYSCKADMWSLGVVAYELITRRLPFPSTDVPELRKEIVSGVFSDVRVYRPDVSPEFAALVMRLLTVDPTMRYSAAEFLSCPYIQCALVGLRARAFTLSFVSLGLTHDDRAPFFSELDQIIHASSSVSERPMCMRALYQLVCAWQAPTATMEFRKPALCHYIHQAFALPLLLI